MTVAGELGFVCDLSFSSLRPESVCSGGQAQESGSTRRGLCDIVSLVRGRIWRIGGRDGDGGGLILDKRLLVRTSFSRRFFESFLSFLIIGPGKMPCCVRVSFCLPV